MIIIDKTRNEKLQHNNLNMNMNIILQYEYLRREEILPSDQRKVI